MNTPQSTRFRQTLCALLLLLAMRQAAAETVVIISAHSPVEALTREQVVNIFMGRYRKLPDGSAVHPLDTGPDTPERRDFYKKLLDKNLAEINAYWARLTFSGRTQPPQPLETSHDVVAAVGRDPHLIGYAERRAVTGPVKILLVLPE